MNDFMEQQREAAAIRADMQTVHKIIYDAKTRYIKAKLKARSKKQAEESEILFANLTDYGNKTEIQDYWGYGGITETERDRLMNLWDMREQHTKDGKKFRDRVIDMLEKAVSRIGDDYQDLLEETDMEARENDRNQAENARYNFIKNRREN